MPGELVGVHAIILSGGGGTRLWPVSTETRPKQFLRLFGELSLFQLTIERVRDCGISDIHVVTNEASADEVRSQAEERGMIVSLILEPIRRDSAPAIAAGVAVLQADYGSEAVAVVLPCDHLVPNHMAFADALRDAVLTAGAGSLVTFGIKPTSPSTEYGYIQQGRPLPNLPDAFGAVGFHEKPDLNTAKDYIKSGKYHWNSGIFVFRVKDFAREAELYMPSIWGAAQDAVARADKTSNSLTLDINLFGQVDKISIDYALFEKSKNIVLLPRSFSWSDVGNWNTFFSMLPHDAYGNVRSGDAAIYDSYNTFAYGDGIRIIALGLNDVIVIASKEGVFITSKNRAAEIKNLI